MKLGFLLCGGAAIALTGSAALAGSVTYSDQTGDLFDNGLTHLDITSVTVSNDDTWVYFTIQTAGNLDTTSWGNYMVAIDTGSGGSNSNAWGRNINHGADNDFWFGSWVNDGGSGAGANFYEYDGSWVERDATYTGNGLISTSDADHASGIQRLAVKISALGLSIGDTFDFDVMSSGSEGNPGGVDHLSVQGQAMGGWDQQSVAGTYLQYTLQSTVVVPLPGAAGMALAGMGLIGLRRRR